MKNFILLLSFLGFGILTQAQIQEEDRSMSEGINPGFVLTIPSSKEKFVLNNWKDYLKENDIRLKRNKKAGEYNALDTQLSKISDGAINIYSRLEMDNGGGVCILWLKEGDNFISAATHPEEAKRAEIFMMKFALKLTIEITKESLKKEEKIQKRLVKNSDKLISKKKSLKKKIEKAKATIKKAEKDIETNAEDQLKTKEEIGKQAEVIKDIKRKLSDLEVDY